MAVNNLLLLKLPEVSHASSASA